MVLRKKKIKPIKEDLWWTNNLIKKSISKDNDFVDLPINTFTMCRNKIWKTGKTYSKHKIMSKLEP